ncbi:NYN domain-containing protein [Vreelandella utahensis]|uniref:NYN domain-containing protein n=1 Tax=Vreelandella halophila TaxID=86177 RepID=UPI00098592A3|nr:NYN domain-containing protein [Halomonas utahensis]
MANFVYVDNSNIWIEGMHVAAAANGKAPDVWDAVTNSICDYDWKFDFGKLFNFVAGDQSDVKRAALFGSRPPRNDSLWNAAEANGFEVIVHDRNVANKEKKVDAEIVTQMMADSYTQWEEGDEFTLVAGDTDYVPTVENLVARGIKVSVVFWEHASRELKAACSEFTPLNQYLDHLAR